jgi:hypothetical protein
MAVRSVSPQQLRARGVRHLTMRSSGLRGESIVFPDVLSARSRLTRRWMLGQGSVGESSSPDCSRGLKRSGPGQQSISGSRLAYLASRFFPGKDQEAQSHSRRFGQAASQITSAHICAALRVHWARSFRSPGSAQTAGCRREGLKVRGTIRAARSV